MTDRLSKCVLAGVAAAGIYGLWASRADAQNGPPCAPAQEFIAALKTKYSEVQIASGIVNPQTVVITLASPEGATWTVLQVNANGMACMLASGENWSGGELPSAGDGV